MSEQKDFENWARSKAGELRHLAGSHHAYVEKYANGMYSALGVMVPDVRDQFAVLGAVLEESIVALPRPLRMRMAREMSENLVRQVRKRLEE
jgi:hypothetical protein